MSIKKGDVVQLKSGGPQMVVRCLGSEDSETATFCNWFDDSKSVKGDWFEMDQLTDA